jgi:polyisoprenoid-binding protein YceI
MWISSLLTGLFVVVVPQTTTTYRVAPDESQFEVEVGRAGLFKVFGHDHRIRVGAFTGTVVWNSDEPESSRFTLEVDPTSLSVADEKLDEDDRAKVQGEMETKVLALSEYATIVFTSSRVRVRDKRGEAMRLELEGTLKLRGESHPLKVPVTLEFSGERMTVTGELELDTKRWGVPQISALGGSVKTKEKLGLTFEIVLVAV